MACFFSASRLILIIGQSPALRSARPTATEAVGIISLISSGDASRPAGGILRNGFSSSTWVLSRLAQRFLQVHDLGRAAGEVESVQRLVRGGDLLEEVERLLDLGADVIVDGGKDRQHPLVGDAVDLLAPLELLGLLGGEVQLFLDRVGVWLPPMLMSRQ